jgi:hypothetical protein
VDLTAYVDRIESAHDDHSALERIRREILADKAVNESDRGFLDGRVGTYLADHDRGRVWTVDDVPDEWSVLGGDEALSD